jgi:hypothetical protein
LNVTGFGSTMNPGVQTPIKAEPHDGSRLYPA